MTAIMAMNYRDDSRRTLRAVLSQFSTLPTVTALRLLEMANQDLADNDFKKAVTLAVQTSLSLRATSTPLLNTLQDGTTHQDKDHEKLVGQRITAQVRESLESHDDSESEADSEASAVAAFNSQFYTAPQVNRKRGADGDVDLADSAGLAANTNSRQGPPRKRQKTTPTAIAPLRRPTRLDAWYSHFTSTEEAWNKLNLQRRRNLSQVAYIQETEAGMVASKPCMGCYGKAYTNINKAGGPGSEKVVCMVYKPEVAKQYTKAHGENWRSCSTCWLKGRNCDFVRDAKREKS